MRYITTIDNQEYVIDIDQNHHILVNGIEQSIDYVHLEGQTLVSILLGHSSYEALVEEREGEYQVLLHGKLYSIRVEDERARRLAKASRTGLVETGELTVKAPMPGLIISVGVEDGQEISAGQMLVVLESMKMQNLLKAPRSGVVTRIRVQSGQTVEQGQALVTIT